MQNGFQTYKHPPSEDERYEARFFLELVVMGVRKEGIGLLVNRLQRRKGLHAFALEIPVEGHVGINQIPQLPLHSKAFF